MALSRTTHETPLDSGRLRWPLPELGEFPQLPPLAGSLMSNLAAAGWQPEPNSDASRWLRLATCHSSFMYEAGETPVSIAALGALSTVGSAWLGVAVADVAVAEERLADRGVQNRLIVKLRDPILRRISETLTVAEVMALGKGEEPNRGRPDGVELNVTLQILGVISLAGGYRAVRQMAERDFDVNDGDDHELNVDWWTHLVNSKPHGEFELEASTAGPDHDLFHVAVIRDRGSRCGRGEGRRKKDARAAAARDYLREVGAVPTPAREKAVRLKGEPLAYRRLADLHDRTVDRLHMEFDVEPGRRAYLQQALTHASWTYEHPDALQKSNQTDYRLLANHGSYVLDAYAASFVAQERLVDALSEAGNVGAIRNLPEGAYSSVFDRLAVRPALLLGAGQKDQCPPTIKADVVQALTAVGWRFGGGRETYRLPPFMIDWIRSAALEHDLDSLSRLTRICAAFGGTVTAEHTIVGPGHQQEVTAQLQATLGDIVLAGAGGPTSGKSGASQQAAHHLLRLFALGSGDDGTRLTSAERAQSAALIQTMIEQFPQLSGRRLQRCVNDGLLGLDRIRSAAVNGIDAFLTWAESVDEILGPMPETTYEQLCSIYRGVWTTSRGRRLEQAVHSVATWVMGLDPEGEVEVRAAAEWDQMLAVTAALRAATTRRREPIAELVARWQQSSPKETAGGPSTDLVLGPGEAAAIDECMNWLRRTTGADDASQAVAVRVLGDGVRVECALAQPDQQDRIRPLADLLTELVPGVQIFVEPAKFAITARFIPETDHRSVAAVGLLASGSPIDHSQLRQLANVLHRLKNDLVCLEDAARRARTGDRLSRLRKLADAVAHHQSACQLAGHLSRTRGTAGHTGEETIEIGRWLDEYCAGQMLRLRTGLRLTPPSRTGLLEIQVAPSLLTEVLDNLVKNAAEALAEGGVISVDWHSEPGHVAIVVEDDGPGLPPRVREAFMRDETVPSSKNHGSGLGLWLVGNTLRRMRAGMSYLPTDRGVRWLIRLPVQGLTEDPSPAPAADQDDEETNIPVESHGTPEETSETGTPEPTIVGRGKWRVLFVDDQQNVAHTIAQHIESVADVIDFAADGTSALARLDEQSYDVIVSDLQMPPGTWGGIWLLDQIRARGLRTPVVVLSGEGGQAQTIDALNGGAKAYVVKAQASEDLTPRLEAVMAEHQRNAIADVHRLPLPFVLGIQRFQAEGDLNLKLRFGHRAVEDSLRFLCCIGLGETAVGETPLAPASAVSNNMTMGRWRGLAQRLQRLPDRNAYTHQVLRHVDADRLRAVVTDRNNVGHGAEPRRDELDRMLNLTTQVLDQLAVGFAQVAPDAVLIRQSLDYDDKQFFITAARVTGPGPVLPSVTMSSALPVDRDSVGLWRPQSSWIPMLPWLVARQGESRGEWSLSCFDGFDLAGRGDLAKVRYRAFGSDQVWQAPADRQLTDLLTGRQPSDRSSL
ncbi:response regulator [Catellatospora paridis]|uniref:response regulator n=1 Tax=Catellatospora paridis TaxID=1617086 RepID=UPI0012D38848|nr:response regulator [Catellatospora paridis]